MLFNSPCANVPKATSFDQWVKIFLKKRKTDFYDALCHIRNFCFSRCHNTSEKSDSFYTKKTNDPFFIFSLPLPRSISGTYFNCIMFMVASSVVTTIMILNYHHRLADTHEMPNWVNLVSNGFTSDFMKAELSIEIFTSKF